MHGGGHRGQRREGASFQRVGDCVRKILRASSGVEIRHGGEKSSYCGGIRVLGVCEEELLIAEGAENCR
jgi:hypothetical protein